MRPGDGWSTKQRISQNIADLVNAPPSGSPQRLKCFDWVSNYIRFPKLEDGAPVERHWKLFLQAMNIDTSFPVESTFRIAGGADNQHTVSPHLVSINSHHLTCSNDIGEVMIRYVRCGLGHMLHGKCRID